MTITVIRNNGEWALLEVPEAIALVKSGQAKFKPEDLIEGEVLNKIFYNVEPKSEPSGPVEEGAKREPTGG